MRRGFTLMEALVVVAVAGIVLGYFSAAAAPRSRELSNRAVCAANLRGLAQSMAVYGASENDAFPCLPPPASATQYDASLKPDLADTADAGDAIHTLYTSNKRASSPTEPLWILVLNGEVSTKQFICKSDSFGGTPAAVMGADSKTTNLNFQDEKNISYSVAYPWTVDQKEKVVVSAIWRDQTDASLPLLSDMAPYVGSKAGPGEVATRPPGSDPKTPVDPDWAVTKANSQNHQFEGQNVAFGDSHVEFTRNPAVGQNMDSIWGIEKQPKGAWNANGAWQPQGGNHAEVPIEAGALPHAPMGGPGQEDVVMVPARDSGGHLK